MWAALGLCTLAGAFTALGGILAVLLPVGQKNTAFAVGFAGGVMVTVSLTDLLPEAYLVYAGQCAGTQAAIRVTVLFFLGAVAAILLSALLPEQAALFLPNKKTAAEKNGGSVALHLEGKKKNAFTPESLQPVAARSALVTLAVVVLHNLPEGVLTLFSGYENLRLGMGVSLAVGLHNLPEGLVIAAPILAAGGSRGKALAAAALSGMAEPLGAVVAFYFFHNQLNALFLNGLLCLVAGMMCAVSWTELFHLGYRLYGKACGWGGIIGATMMALGVFLIGG